MDMLPQPKTLKEVYTLLKTRCKCSQCHERLLDKVYSSGTGKNTLLCELCTENKDVELSDKEAMANFGIYIWSMNDEYKVFISHATRILCMDSDFTCIHIMPDAWKTGRMESLPVVLANFVGWDVKYSK